MSGQEIFDIVSLSFPNTMKLRLTFIPLSFRFHKNISLLSGQKYLGHQRNQSESLIIPVNIIVRTLFHVTAN